MIGRLQRRFRRAPRRCVFCGDGGTRANRMSEEHLWPEWMHPYLPVNEEHGKREIYGTISQRLFHAVRKKPQRGQVFRRRFALPGTHTGKKQTSRAGRFALPGTHTGKKKTGDPCAPDCCAEGGPGHDRSARCRRGVPGSGPLLATSQECEF